MKLMLGTAQFGSHYGIANVDGAGTYHRSLEVMNTAMLGGIYYYDTAKAYGNSESVIGKILRNTDLHAKVVTKVLCRPDDPEHIIQDIRDSLVQLGLDSVHGVLVHNSDILLDDSYDVFNMLIKAKSIGLTESIGVSVYDPESAVKILQKYPLDIVQIPSSILDQRLNEKYIEAITDYGAEIHVRSIFLQGLMFISPENLDPYFSDISDTLQNLHEVAARYDTTVSKMAIEYAKSLQGVSRIIVGVDNADHLSEIVCDYHAPFDCDLAFRQFSIEDDKFINPSKWRV